MQSLKHNLLIWLPLLNATLLSVRSSRCNLKANRRRRRIYSPKPKRILTFSSLWATIAMSSLSANLWTGLLEKEGLLERRSALLKKRMWFSVKNNAPKKSDSRWICYSQRSQSMVKEVLPHRSTSSGLICLTRRGRGLPLMVLMNRYSAEISRSPRNLITATILLACPWPLINKAT